MIRYSNGCIYLIASFKNKLLLITIYVVCEVLSLNIVLNENSILSLLLFILFIYFYPRLYIWQIITKLESEVVKLEEYSREAQNTVIKNIKKPKKDVRAKVRDFMNFFVLEPVSVDPYGILKKMEHIIKTSEKRIEAFVDRISDEKSYEKKKNIKYGLLGAMSVTTIYRVVRHYVETIKKTNNLQLALILQMMLPDIMRIAKANVKATKAFVEGIPIGDGIGPLVAALNKKKKGEEIERDVVVSEERIANKKVLVMKAKGPGAEISQARLWRAIEQIIKKKRIKHIISIDASLKLEGEKTGSVAEGVGVAMSPYGVDRAFIEELATKHNIELDGIAIKMSDYEASIPMKREIYNSIPEVQKKLEEIVASSPYKSILVVGVGNTCGIGNSRKEVEKLDKILRPIWRKQKKEEEEERKKKKWWSMP